MFDETGASLSRVAKLDTMVTVVDALNFLGTTLAVRPTNSPEKRGESAGEEDERTLVDLLTDQIELRRRHHFEQDRDLVDGMTCTWA